jgi:hypothetical protein
MWKPGLIACLMIATLGSAAEARKPSRKAPPVQWTDSKPLIRIPGVPRTAQLTPLQFGDFVRKDWRKGQARRYALNQSPTVRLNTMSEDFRLADADGDGRVSGIELADYLLANG